MIEIKKYAALTLMLAAPLACGAELAEAWECKKEYGKWDEIVFEAVVYQGYSRGGVISAGAEHESAFRTRGFDRIWEYDGAGVGSLRHVLLIKHDGAGEYYESAAGEKSAGPAMYLECRGRDVHSPSDTDQIVD